MSNNLFTEKDVKKLGKNKYVKKVFYKAIIYTNEFKEKVVFETENYRKFPRQVFEECGFDIDVIGLKRIENVAYKWRKQYKKCGELRELKGMTRYLCNCLGVSTSGYCNLLG